MRRIAHDRLARHPRPAAVRLRRAVLVAAIVILVEWSYGSTNWVGGASAMSPVSQSFTPLSRIVQTSVVDPPVDAFLAAFARSDEATAERVASSLYRAEWVRRGVDVQQREAIAPGRSLPDGSRAPWITFALAGGTVDAYGFRHLLYAASQPTCDSGCHASSVWRVDTEPSGRVIWAEMVWLFSRDVSRVVKSPSSNGLRRDLLPDALAARQPRLLVAVRSATSVEGFYAVAADGDPHAIVFFAIGPDGEARPGAWSYGSRDTGVSEYGTRTAARLPRLPLGDEALQRSYLAALS